MTFPATQNLATRCALVLVAAVLAGCHSTPPPTEAVVEPPPPPPVQIRSSQPMPVPRMGVVTQEIAGHTRLFSSFGFWMMDAPLKTELLACFRANGTLDREKLRATFPDAKIVEGRETVAVALPSGTFNFFLLQDGPLISLDPKYDNMVQQMSAKARTGP